MKDRQLTHDLLGSMLRELKDQGGWSDLLDEIQRLREVEQELAELRKERDELRAAVLAVREATNLAWLAHGNVQAEAMLALFAKLRAEKGEEAK